MQCRGLLQRLSREGGDWKGCWFCFLQRLLWPGAKPGGSYPLLLPPPQARQRKELHVEVLFPIRAGPGHKRCTTSWWHPISGVVGHLALWGQGNVWTPGSDSNAVVRSQRYDHATPQRWESHVSTAPPFYPLPLCMRPPIKVLPRSPPLAGTSRLTGDDWTSSYRRQHGFL